jgi:hypothetical protein
VGDRRQVRLWGLLGVGGGVGLNSGGWLHDGGGATSAACSKQG